MPFAPQQKLSERKMICKPNTQGEMECEWKTIYPDGVITEFPERPESDASVYPSGFADPLTGQVIYEAGSAGAGAVGGGAAGALGAGALAILGLLVDFGMKLGAQILANKLAPPLDPIVISDGDGPNIPSISQQSISWPSPQPISIRPLSSASTPARRPIQESSYYQALNRIREIQQQEADRLRERNVLRDTSHTLRGMIEAYGPTKFPDLPPLERNQPSHTFQPSVDPSVKDAFRNRINPSSGANRQRIQEDQRWIQKNLSHASKPVSWQEQVRMQQAEQQAYTQQQMQQTQLEAAKAQREMYEAQIQAIRWQHYQEDSRKTPATLKATVYKSRNDIIRDKFFKYPGKEKSLLEQLESSRQTGESRFEQMDMNLENMAAQGEITAREKAILKAGMSSLMTRHWLTHELAYTDQGTAIYRGVEMPTQVAPHVVYADAKHYAQTYQHLSKPKLEQAAKDFTNALANGSKLALQAAYDLWIGDDIKTLTDPKVNLFWKAVAGASLLSNFVPAGLVGKMGGKILGKVTGKASSKVLTRIAEMFEKKGVQHLGDIPQNTGEVVNDTKKLELVRERLKKELDLNDLPDDHAIMREIKDRHIKLNAWSGRASATEVFTTKDKQTVIFRTRVKDQKHEDAFAIWTTAVDKKGTGTVLLKGHENYKIEGHLADGREKVKIAKYEEEIPGPKAPLGETVKTTRGGIKRKPKEQVHIEFDEKAMSTEQIMEKLEKRWNEFVFKRGEK